MSLIVQRASQRFVTRGDGWVGRYCFSYGEHYDPDNVSFGLLVACNEFEVAPGHGFGRHHHGGIEVVSWVLEGTLLHDDAERITAGGLQVMSTGSGVEHSETNPGPEALRLLQLWLVPAEDGGEPEHHLVAAPGGFGPVELGLRQPAATLHAGHLAAGEQAVLPGPLAFVLVTDGTVEVAGERLGAGDSARLSEPGHVTATTDARLLAWGMTAPAAV